MEIPDQVWQAVLATTDKPLRVWWHRWRLIVEYDSEAEFALGCLIADWVEWSRERRASMVDPLVYVMQRSVCELCLGVETELWDEEEVCAETQFFSDFRCTCYWDRETDDAPEIPTLPKDRSGYKRQGIRKYVPALLKRDGGNCQICQCVLEGDFHVDHIQPVSKGGTDDLDNLQLAHARCNISKGAKVV